MIEWDMVIKLIGGGCLITILVMAVMLAIFYCLDIVIQKYRKNKQ